MSIEGSINVSALFHDKDGTTAMKVVSLRSSDEYTTGKVAIITGTAGTAMTAINMAAYKDSSGNNVGIDQISRVMFSWNNAAGAARKLEIIDVDDTVQGVLVSRNREVAASSVQLITDLRLTASANNTGTYAIVLYGQT